MILQYHGKEIPVKNCTSFKDRLIGFMGCKNINKSLLFERCNSIHTFFMRENIDVILCDRDNRVIFYYSNLGKNRVILPKKNVCKVFETPAFYFDIVVGDVMKIIE